MAPRIVNLAEWRGQLLAKLERKILHSRSEALMELHAEILEYGGPPESEEQPEGLVVPLQLRYRGRVLSFFCTMATFGMPLDVTLSELAIETFSPYDSATRHFLLESNWSTAVDSVAAVDRSVKVPELITR